MYRSRGIQRVVILTICTLLSIAQPIDYVAASQSPVQALPAPTTYWLDSPQLLISAYQRSNDGSDIQLVEVYNDGDTPLDIRDWSIVGTFKPATTQQVSMEIIQQTQGLLEPQAHAVIDAAGFITNASYTMEKWSSVKPSGILTSLSVIPKSVSMATNEYVLKSTATNYDYAELWRRTPSSASGYLPTSTSFTASPIFQVYDQGLYAIPAQPDIKIVEIYPYASDCTPTDNSALCGDYVKLYNPTNNPIDLSDYALRTDSSSTHRTTSNTIRLDGMVIAAHGYLPVMLTNDGDKLSLTNSGGYVWLEDAWGLMRYDATVTHYESAGTSKQGYSYAVNIDAIWDWTSSPVPMGQNIFSPSETSTSSSVGACPIGSYRNPETNRCRAIEEAVNELTTCPEGQARNPATNRCRSTAAATSATLAPCGEGQERSPTTNRCRSISSAVAELLPCDEGYERNPTTNRCRKELLSTMPIAKFPIEPIKQSAQSLLGWWAFAGVAILGLGYGVWEWRREIRNMFSGVRLAVTSLFR